jgi:hypothetical protein
MNAQQTAQHLRMPPAGDHGQISSTPSMPSRRQTSVALTHQHADHDHHR